MAYGRPGVFCLLIRNKKSCLFPVTLGIFSALMFMPRSPCRDACLSGKVGYISLMNAIFENNLEDFLAYRKLHFSIKLYLIFCMVSLETSW